MSIPKKIATTAIEGIYHLRRYDRKLAMLAENAVSKFTFINVDSESLENRHLGPEDAAEWNSFERTTVEGFVRSSKFKTGSPNLRMKRDRLNALALAVTLGSDSVDDCLNLLGALNKKLKHIDKKRLEDVLTVDGLSKKRLDILADIMGIS
jgi:hypothetical protein